MQQPRRLVVLFLALLLLGQTCCCSAAKADEPAAPDDGVLRINTDNVDELLERQTAPALVVFIVVDKCDDCKQLTMGLPKVAANLKGIASVGIVDCTDHRAVRTCRSYNAMSFPKILVFKPGTKVNPYTGGSMKDFSVFTGAVSAKSLISAVTDTLDSAHITALSTAAEHEAFLQKEPKLAKVLLFTDKPASTVLAKAMSWAYARRLLFAEVRPAGGDGRVLAEQYMVEKFPTILVLKPDGNQELYSGALKAPELRSFLDGFAPSEPLLEGAGSDKSGVKDPLSQLAQVEVHSLDTGNLTDIDQKDTMWLIAFYATAEGDTCAAQLEELHKLLVEVQGLVSYGTFNTTGVDQKVLKPYELNTAALSASPCAMQLVLLPFGEFKQTQARYRRWSGGLDNAKALQDWILKFVPDFTIPLSNEYEAQSFMDATAEDLPKPAKARTLQEHNPPIGKVFLFTNQDHAPPIYKALAMQFVGNSRLLFAWIKVSTNEGPAYPLMQRMNVRKAPAMTILFPLPQKPLGADNDEVPNSPRDNMAMQQYMGQLKYQKMLGWLTAMSTLTGLAYKTHAGATKGPAPPDFEIRTQDQLESACYDQPGLCLITLVDGRSSAANKHRDTVKKAAAAHAGQPVNWVVVDVSRQPSFRRAYGFTSDQLPALLALSTKRMRFAQGPAPFGEDSAKQLVQKVLMGTAVTLPLPDLPRLVDGGEAEEDVLNVEEEFKLDEVMAEEVKELFRKEERLAQAEAEVQQEALQKQQKKKTQKKSGSKKKSKKKKGKQKDNSTKAKSKPVRDEL